MTMLSRSEGGGVEAAESDCIMKNRRCGTWSGTGGLFRSDHGSSV